MKKGNFHGEVFVRNDVRLCTWCSQRVSKKQRNRISFRKQKKEKGGRAANEEERVTLLMTSVISKRMKVQQSKVVRLHSDLFRIQHLKEH